MSRRIPVIILAFLLGFSVACSNKRVKNPLANLDSKQPDKVLFDRAMAALKRNRFDVARLTLQTLINTYPDSEYIARAKLAVADSWYAEGGSTAWAQAEIEYNDFKTFFPNMPEAAEAQLKIANIHYQLMEKPDRDFTHAMRAQDEYRNLILQFPDSKLIPEAKKRLMDVQEVLAEREYRIGNFYFMRESYPASIARLRSVVDRYPLYSRADEVLYLLGQAYEQEIALVQRQRVRETDKARLIQDLTDHAAEAYSRILKRYPVMDRAYDAKERLEALHKPVPRPTKAAVAQNKAEEASRRESGTLAKVMGSFRKRPDTSHASRKGEPTLVDPKPLSATEVVQEASRAMMGTGSTGANTVSVETIKDGAPPPNQPTPRSDAPAPTTDSAAVTPIETNELKPNVEPGDANELKPNVAEEGAQPTPPQQVNQIDGSSGDGSQASASSQQEEEDITYSSSKRKKKKGLRKIVPF